MADAAGATPLLPGLPNDIAIEILVRLPPKPLLRCRAVSPAWRRATSARDFLLSHHARQPALPLLYSIRDLADGGTSLDIVPLDHRAGVAAADRLQSVVRLDSPHFFYQLRASCDGLLILSNTSDGIYVCDDLYVCNPATRQYASLQQQLHGFDLLEMYPHPPTGEYRLLLYRPDDDQPGTYVFTIGSSQPPRHIGCPDLDVLGGYPGLLFQGSIYWYITDWIMVFDTNNESCRHISAPVDHPLAQLFEMGDMLGIFCDNYEETAIDIWVMQHNHQGEVWDLKCQVEYELAVAETGQKCECSRHKQVVMVVPGDSGLIILINWDNKWMFQLDVEAKLIASFQLPRGFDSTHFVLKQTLVQHAFFPTLEGYVVDAPPLVSSDLIGDYVVNT